MDGYDGFREYYVAKRRSFAWVWGCVCGLVLVCWIVHVVPFSYASVVSKAVVVSRSCASKGFSYTYSYEVDGQAYTGATQWGGWDGNGSCQKLEPGVVIPITYRVDDPSRSMSGTVSAWNKTLIFLWVWIAIFSFVILPIPLYIKELRSSR